MAHSVIVYYAKFQLSLGHFVYTLTELQLLETIFIYPIKHEDSLSIIGVHFHASLLIYSRLFVNLISFILRQILSVLRLKAGEIASLPYLLALRLMTCTLRELIAFISPSWTGLNARVCFLYYVRLSICSHKLSQRMDLHF